MNNNPSAHMNAFLPEVFILIKILFKASRTASLVAISSSILNFVINSRPPYYVAISYRTRFSQTR